MNIVELAKLRKLFGGSSGGGSAEEEWFNDGNTHIWISLPKGRTSPMLSIGINGTVTVDWGDNTEIDTLTNSYDTVIRSTPMHNYASDGNYIITLTISGKASVIGYANNGSTYLLVHSISNDGRNRAYTNAIQRVELGGVTSLRDSAFYNCFSLSSINIPDSVTSIGTQAFYNCYSLLSIKIPYGVTSIGDKTFYYCFSLSSINIPDSVTSIGTQAFYYCSSLSSINIPDSVTSIGAQAFQYCCSLSSINIPDSVTSVGAQAFYNCYGLSKIRFDGTTPPTVSDSNAFANIPTDCTISVPVGSLEAYKTATNYPDPNTYTYVEE